MIARKRLGVLGAAIVSAGAVIAAPGMASPAHTTAHNRRVAIRDAASLLGLVSLPTGTTRSAREPAGDHGVLKRPPEYPATPNLVDQTEWWTSTESQQQVLSYVKANAPKGGNQNFGGSSGQCTPHTSPPTGCHTTASMIGFTFHPRAGVLGERTLLVEVTRLKDGSTGIRVDAEVVWISARPRSEKVPAGVSLIDVGQDVRGQPPSVSRSVTKPAQIRKIIRLIDRLPITQPGTSSCPAEPVNPPVDTFAFESGSGAVLATARVPADADNSTTGCYPMHFTVNGKSEPSLGQAKSFLVAVGRLLGVKLTRQAYPGPHH